MIIAVDGPAGSGKSTVAKRVAARVGIQYLDTGAMYRAFTLYILESTVPLEDLDAIRALLDSFSLQMSENRVFLNGRDVTTSIRSEKVDSRVSYVSSLGFVREKMVELQQRIGENTSLIAEGRDITTVVFPYADYKFYLDADIQERARRRIHDEKNPDSKPTGSEQTLYNMVEKLQSRDAYDSNREISPLRRAEDAVYIDTTDLDIDQVCARIIRIIHDSQRGAWCNER
jgi:cytidylate kinase